MKVVISAGGTGGHIYPALAIINKIKEKEPGSTFLYIGTHNRMEKDIVPKEGIPFRSIEIYGLSKKNILANFKTVNCMRKGYKKCIEILKEFKPDVVIGVGGYVTVPVILAAHKLSIPAFIHEQNSIPGKANLFLAKYVSKVGVSFPSTMNSFSKEKAVFTGNPCSEEAIKKPPMDKSFLGLSPHKKLVLIVMGSLGAGKINTYILSLMPYFKVKEYEVVFVTGKGDYDSIPKEKIPKNVFVFPYIDNMTRLMKKVDVMVSRAGASTMSEIMSLSIPTVLIPSPYVPNNHQFKNAMDLVDKKAALLLEEKDLKGDILIRKIEEAMTPKVAEEMKRNLKALAVNDSADRVYKEVCSIIDRK